jgi:NADPH-dependent 2,4-dienoyl-CoA reductase/sulfur reductase-like enzyme/rhodanese-related sulfurtransferase
MKVVVIGGVAGGMSAAARLRRLDELAKIIVFERGEHVSFANCGLPYHIGGDIPERASLLLRTPEGLRETLDLDVRTESEVVAIDRVGQTVTVREVVTGRLYTETYDRLVLATGATPLRPPLPGIDHPRVRTLRNIADMDDINELLAGEVRSAVVVGGGYIGLEMVEALRKRGLRVTVVEALDQVMTVLDREMSQPLLEELEANGVRVLLSKQVKGFIETPGRIAVDVGTELIETDLVLLAIGVRPDSTLASVADLELSERGAIVVNEQMRTSDPDIYAVGDSVQVIDTVTGEQVVIPLAGPANRQGRIAADNIAGHRSAYTTTQGTGIVKLFGLTAATTGANERTLTRLGRPFSKIYLHPFDHATYYPGALQLHLKVLFDSVDGRLLGAQIVGSEGVDKRIDVLAVALRAGMTIEDLESLELAYAPPYGAAKDPINMAGFVGGNLRRGDVLAWQAEDWPTLPNAAFLLDVRSHSENAAWSIPGSTNIPLPELRDRIAEIPLGRPVFVYCRSGFRSYLAQRLLVQRGHSDSRTLAGGELTFRMVHPSLPTTRNDVSDLPSFKPTVACPTVAANSR